MTWPTTQHLLETELSFRAESSYGCEAHDIPPDWERRASNVRSALSSWSFVDEVQLRTRFWSESTTLLPVEFFVVHLEACGYEITKCEVGVMCGANRVARLGHGQLTAESPIGNTVYFELTCFER